MKRLLGFLLWALAVPSYAQFTPGQLLTASELNTQFALYAPLAGATFTGPVSLPSGSSVAGYLTSATAAATYAPIASPTFTGTVTIPSGTQPLTVLSSQAANTVVANASASSSSPTAIAVPSCSTTSSALQWTSGTGLGCNTTINASTLGGATFASPPAAGYGSTTPEPVAATTLSSTGNFTPSQTNGIVGTTTNNNANAGSVGEYITASTLATSATSGTSLNGTSISLSAGDWDVMGICGISPAGSTNVNTIAAGISTTSATFGTVVTGISNYQLITGLNNTGLAESPTAPMSRLSLSGNTTVFLVCQANFTVSTLTISGWMRARRVR